MFTYTYRSRNNNHTFGVSYQMAPYPQGGGGGGGNFFFFLTVLKGHGSAEFVGHCAGHGDGAGLPRPIFVRVGSARVVGGAWLRGCERVPRRPRLVRLSSLELGGGGGGGGLILVFFRRVNVNVDVVFCFVCFVLVFLYCCKP